jgi:hypothetical protein
VRHAARYVGARAQAQAGPAPVRRVAQVACGGLHTLAVTESGRLFAWGANGQGQLGLGRGVRAAASPALVTALTGETEGGGSGLSRHPHVTLMSR